MALGQEKNQTSACKFVEKHVFVWKHLRFCFLVEKCFNVK
jgi:hypothetical protein